MIRLVIIFCIFILLILFQQRYNLSIELKEIQSKCIVNGHKGFQG